MSATMYGMPGLGSNGMGNSGGGALPPDLVQRLMQMQQQQQQGQPGQGGAPPMGGPPPVQGHPMNAVGGGGGMPMPQGGAAGPQAPPNMLQALGGPQGIAQLMQMYKGNQAGVQPQMPPQGSGGATVNGSGPNNNSFNPSALWSLIQGGFNPYGATGNGMGPITGASGMAGGGV